MRRSALIALLLLGVALAPGGGRARQLLQSGNEGGDSGGGGGSGGGGSARGDSANATAAGAGARWPDPALADSFVAIKDREFVLGCRRFPISGLNQWEVMEASAGAPRLAGSVLPPGTTGPQLIRSALDTMSAQPAGMTVARAWAHGVSADYPSLVAHGEYSEGILRGLDYFLAEAGKRGIKVILSFTSNWTPVGGVDQFANLTGTDHNGFFTSSAAKALFKDYVRAIVTRVNSITGRANRDDPTIMAWGLINEPVCRGCPPGTIAAWVKEMAAFVKSLDSNHLLTVGEEGFYSTTKTGVPFNPGHPDTEWATEWNQDFKADHASPDIDFGSIHVWPGLWKCLDCQALLSVDFVKRYIQQHIKDAAALGKPLLLEEFGAEADRDAYFRAAFEAVEESLQSGAALKGALFWQFYAPAQTASKGDGGGAGRFGVYPDSSTFQLVKANAAAVQRLAAAAGGATQCTKQGAPAAPPCANNGFEGPGCTLDINECVRGTAGCGQGAVCENTEGSFRCACPPGTTGDGTDGCKNDTAAVSASLARFYHEPGGQACDLGRDVPYPKTALGWADDPTGSTDRNPAFAGGAGARLPVTLGECALACEAAQPGCDALTWNAALRGCFLKTAQCPLRNDCQRPEERCSSVSDMGKQVSINCGQWSTWWRQEVWDRKQEYCSALDAGNGTRLEAFSSSSGGGGK